MNIRSWSVYKDFHETIRTFTFVRKDMKFKHYLSMFNCKTPSKWQDCLYLISFWFTNKHYLLPPLNANPDTITMSGIASGAYMATNMHVIYSKTIKGVGLVAGGPYGFNEDIEDKELFLSALD